MSSTQLIPTQVQFLVSLTVFLPLLGLVINAIGYRLFSKRATSCIASGAVIISSLLSWIILSYMVSYFSGETLSWELFNWLDFEHLNIAFGFQVDQLTSLMLVVVTTVSACVHVYSIEYMEHDDGYRRFFLYLNLFVFAMIILVTANNLLLLFIGWEGVGLCSYLLIGFWYDRKSARKAGQKAFIVNRLGDFSLLIGIFLIILQFQTLNFTLMELTINEVPNQYLVSIGLLLLGGAIGKSAQFPLYVWLPDAMEGPTPVSSLIHAATMVTAGIYLIARMQFLYDLIPAVGWTITFIGSFTALFAASIALVHNDMKRILAYSTISQLGYMFAAVGLGAYSAAIFHLATHAFFKGLLFLMAGSVMHALHGELNIFKMDNLFDKLPYTGSMALIGGLGLSGFPLISGFWSKDEILLATLEHSHTLNWIVFTILSGAAFLTAFYTFRLIFVAFWAESSNPASPDSIHECGLLMGFPMGLLAVGTLIGGYFTVWTEGIVTGSSHAGGHPPHLLVTAISIAVSLGGIGLAYFIYLSNTIDTAKATDTDSMLHNILDNQYYVENIYNTIIVSPVKKFSGILWRVVDDILIDGVIHLSAIGVEISGLVLRFFQTGRIRHYLMVLVISMISVMMIATLVMIGL